MINLRNRTEFSFNYAVGRIGRVLEQQDPKAKVAGIVDRHGTWGHMKWAKECKARGVRPIFGVELAVVVDTELRDKQPTSYMTLLAKDQSGLRELYEIVSWATEKFYYVPRINYNIVANTKKVIVLSGPSPDWEQIECGWKNFFVELNPMSSPDVIEHTRQFGYKLVATNDNLYPTANDLSVYQMILENKAQMSTTPQHILPEWEWMGVMQEKGIPLAQAIKAIHTTAALSNSFTATVPEGKMVKPKVTETLEKMCRAGATKRKIPLINKGPYLARLQKELKLIQEKSFEDYFFVVADMLAYAKENMMVGPARGSSCGSLVCFLLGITDIDPLPHGLLFERFIDVTREDPPDIDIDFQDDRRELVFAYLREKYGETNVGRLGNVNQFKAKSAITAVAKQLQVPIWEVEDLKKSIIERSTGDARAQFCIADTFEQLEIGRKTLEKYPELALAGELEGHASHSGMHSAGIVITADALTHYCSVNHKTGTLMLDMRDAKEMNLLKIDALGLRTLTVLQDTLSQIGWPREKLIGWRTDDPKAFAILNDGKFSGIFQYEGYALQSVAKQMTAGRGITKFDDVAVITALARPGPFNSGGTSEFLERHAGRKKVHYLHPLMKDITEHTFGVIIYQEQVMQIAKQVGDMTWEDVSDLRRAMSKSYGEEYFNQYWLKFYRGAAGKHGLSHLKAEEIWKTINTMGSWAFNQSHAVAYGTISYWCCVLKAYYPLEFAAACLRHSRDDDTAVKMLRELVREGYSYTPYDAFLSDANWTVKDGQLIGGLMSIKGVGEKIAAEIISKRNTQHPKGKQIPFTPRELKFLNSGQTPWDKIFEADDLWRHVFKNPKGYGIDSKLMTLAEIGKIDLSVQDQECVFIAKLKTKNLRDHNEAKSIARRNGKVMAGQTLYLHVTVDDDTENNVLLTIGRGLYPTFGKPIVESGRIGDWYLWKANIDKGRLFVQRWRKMTGNEKFTRKNQPVRKEPYSRYRKGGQTLRPEHLKNQKQKA